MHLNITAFTTSDMIGGANVGSFRVLSLLEKRTNLTHFVLVKAKGGNHTRYLFPLSSHYDDFLKFFQKLQKIVVLKSVSSKNTYFSLNLFPSLVDCFFLQRSFSDEAIYIHWIGRGFISIPALFLLSLIRPHTNLTIKFADQFYLTGGCHYSLTCLNWLNSSCACCPQTNHLMSTYIRLQFLLKKQAFSRFKRLKIICPSTWLYKQVTESPLFSSAQIFKINNYINEPLHTSLEDKLRRISENCLNIGFFTTGFEDPRKNFKFLLESISCLANLLQSRGITLALYCAGSKSILIDKELEKYNISNCINLGVLPSHDLPVKFYSKINAFIHFTLSDNAPNAILESFANSVPVITNDCCGNPEFVSSNLNGHVISSNLTKSDMKKALLNSSLSILNNYKSFCKNAFLTYSNTCSESNIVTSYLSAIRS